MNTTLSDPKTIKKLINVVNEMLPEDDKEPINKRDVEQCIKQARCMTIFKNITDEEAAEACKKIITMHSASATRGTAIVNRDHKKWFLQKKPSLDMEYWERFKQYLKSDKHFSNRIIANMDLDTDEIVDLLGNPDTKNAMQRRGLIIGDVQSGKTANYSGVICKAADAGYRVIILLAGTSNDLRRQTQSRLDEAFLGFDSSAATRQHQAKIVGVGKYNSGLRPIAVTNTDRDFSRKITQVSMGLPKNGDSAPMLFVCKKNVGVLESLYNWIDTNNRYGNNKIDNSLLMIDDEADYALIPKEMMTPLQPINGFARFLRIFALQVMLDLRLRPMLIFSLTQPPMKLWKTKISSPLIIFTPLNRPQIISVRAIFLGQRPNMKVCL